MPSPGLRGPVEGGQEGSLLFQAAQPLRRRPPQHLPDQRTVHPHAERGPGLDRLTARLEEPGESVHPRHLQAPLDPGDGRVSQTIYDSYMHLPLIHLREC